MLIDYKNVNIYQEDKCVLSGANFHVDEGEFIYIIGKVGSGKSSLLKTIYCELDIDKDEAEKAEVLGYSLLRLKRSKVPALRRQLGVIFQDFQLLHDRTVLKNLQFVLKATGWTDKEEINARIDEVLGQVGMADKKDKMPHELSGGEQQRIVIARAMLNDPPLLLADEPTANLDPDTANQIMTRLVDISCKGTTVLVSTHNLSLSRDFKGRIITCADRQITE